MCHPPGPGRQLEHELEQKGSLSACRCVKGRLWLFQPTRCPLMKDDFIPQLFSFFGIVLPFLFSGKGCSRHVHVVSWARAFANPFRNISHNTTKIALRLFWSPDRNNFLHWHLKMQRHSRVTISLHFRTKSKEMSFFLSLHVSEWCFIGAVFNLRSDHVAEPQDFLYKMIY